MPYSPCEPRGARQDATLIVDDRFGHLHGAGRRRVVRRAGLEMLHDLGAAVPRAIDDRVELFLRSISCVIGMPLTLV